MTEQTTSDLFQASFDQLSGAFIAAKIAYREDFNNISVECWQNLTCARFSMQAVACHFPRTPKTSDFTRLPREWEAGAEVTTDDNRQIILSDRTPYLLTDSIILNDQLFVIPIFVPEIEDKVRVLWSTLASRPKLSVIEKSK